jgi:hypothetical protein
VETEEAFDAPLPLPLRALGAYIADTNARAYTTTLPEPYAVPKSGIPTQIPMSRYKGVDYDSLCKHMTHLIFFSIEVAQDGSLAAMDRCSVYGV